MRSINTLRAGALRSEDPKVILERHWLDIEAARFAIAHRQASAIRHTARGLLTALANIRVRVELEHAAAAFAEGLEERPEAEHWVFFAVAARATLEQAARNGASDLSGELAELDETFEEAREAVLLLEPEDYKEALTATPPNLQAWWGERARLDAGLREIDLERVLSDLTAE